MLNPNHLIKEKSPYLLQHAHNPVDWYPWGKEAFDKARREKKPVLLSVGYSTCHWCHVMAHESFENEQIAKVMNEYFVNIKVDREERPDIDHIYMTSVSAMTGQGGWPLTVFLTPDQKPFYGGTYFLPYAKYGSPGFIDVLMSIQQSWTNDREKIESSSLQLTGIITAHLPKTNDQSKISTDVLDKSYGEFAQNYDPEYGGFGSAPKFPTSHNLSLLLRYAKRTGNEQALNMVIHTLTQMAAGGIYDHLGGGFHRYSTDREWQVPHFEKMLYDQALIVRTYLEAYQYTREPLFADVVRKTLEYVLRDLQSPAGSFYSAEDADSADANGEHKEGAFYVWPQKEIIEALGEKDAEIFNYRFGIEPNGNALSDPHGEFINQNIIWSTHTLHDTAEKFKQKPEAIPPILEKAKAKLFELRQKRPRPHLDDKILVDWNGLMIGSLALAAVVLDDKRYLNAASKAADFILEHMLKENRLYHRYRDEEVAILGSIGDYAFFTWGLLDLFEAKGGVKYLIHAVALAEQMLNLFWDEKGGGFYFSGNDDEELIMRPKEIYDGAIPSGNSVAVSVLLRLFHITSNSMWKDKAQKVLNGFANQINERPGAYSQMLIGYDFLLGPVKEVVIAGVSQMKPSDIYPELWTNFIPHKVVIHRPVTPPVLEALGKIAPFVVPQEPVNKQLTVYVCENTRCQLPVFDAKGLKERLKGE